MLSDPADHCIACHTSNRGHKRHIYKGDCRLFFKGSKVFPSMRELEDTSKDLPVPSSAEDTQGYVSIQTTPEKTEPNPTQQPGAVPGTNTAPQQYRGRSRSSSGRSDLSIQSITRAGQTQPTYHPRAPSRIRELERMVAEHHQMAIDQRKQIQDLQQTLDEVRDEMAILSVMVRSGEYEPPEEALAEQPEQYQLTPTLDYRKVQQHPEQAW